MRRILVATSVALCILAVSAAGSAQIPDIPCCKRLSSTKRAIALKLLASQHPYACCDESIADCLKAKKVCKLAGRLAANICRRVEKGQSEATIVRALARRARSMASGMGARAKIDLEGWPVAGDAKAKVVLVEYACARCPFCAKITPVLHQAITKGALRGKVKLVFKPFPIRNHAGSKEAGLAFVAAARLGKFWPFALHAYQNFSSFSVAGLGGWARAVGLDQARFAQLLAEGETRKRLIAAKKEGLRNKVKATPTFFIDGQRYEGELELAELLDVLGEAAER